MPVRYLNRPLWAGLLLASLLLLMLALPSLAPLRHPNLGQLVFPLNGDTLAAPLSPGQAGFLLGTDKIGRDLFARLIWGTRYTLVTALAIALLQAALALPLGLWLRRAGPQWDRWLTALGTGIQSVPLLALTGITLNGLRLVIHDPTEWLRVYALVLAAAGLPAMAEQVRQRTQGLCDLPFLEGAHAVGASPLRILWHHLLPHAADDLVVLLARAMARTLTYMGLLALFGVAVGSPAVVQTADRAPFLVEYTPEWGQMLSATTGLLGTYPWIPLPPALALAASALCFRLLAEGIRQQSQPR